MKAIRSQWATNIRASREGDPKHHVEIVAITESQEQVRENVLF